MCFPKIRGDLVVMNPNIQPWPCTNFNLIVQMALKKLFDLIIYPYYIYELKHHLVYQQKNWGWGKESYLVYQQKTGGGGMSLIFALFTYLSLKFR